MKKVLLIEPDGVPRNLPRCASLLAGAVNLGYEVRTIHSPTRADDFPIDSEVEFAICGNGLRSTLEARSTCERLGIPVLIVELGFLKRANSNDEVDGYFQLGWNKLCDIPTAAPADRWEALGLEALPPRRWPGEYLLVASQVGFDSQHNLSTSDLTRWLTHKAREMGRKLRQPAVWRSHPKQAHATPSDWDARLIQNTKAVSLSAALDKADAVVTYNSTLGVDAMLRGLPVYSHPSAHYHEYAVRDLATRLKYLQRLAYAQWTLSELESGAPIEYMLSRLPD